MSAPPDGIAPPTGSRREVFLLGDRAVTVDDIVDAAEFRGELGEARGRLLLQGPADEPDRETLQAMSDEFRYDRDLISAEETERWLEARDLTLDDLIGHLVRRHRLASSRGKNPRRGNAKAPAPTGLRGELGEALRAELWLSGDLERMARDLGWRLVARFASPEGLRPSGEGIDAERESFLRRCGLGPRTLEAWLGGVQRDAAWLEEMVATEAAYRATCAAVLTAERLSRETLRSKLLLTRFEVETLEVDTLDAAREARVCVGTDGRSMERLARTARYPYERFHAIFEDLPESWQRPLLAAAPGDVLPPIDRGDGFQVCRVLVRHDPDLEAEDIRTRIARRILESHFSDLGARCLHWIIAPEWGA